MKHSRTLRLPAIAVAIALVGLMVAACGSSSNTGSASSSSSSSAAGAAGGANSAARSKFAACLKAHGVTLPSRPAGSRQPPPGGGYGEGAPGFFFGGGDGEAGQGGGAPGGGRFNNPKFRAALQACGGGRFPQRRAALNTAAITKFTACVKQHGYTLPTPNFSGKGPVFPASIQKDKKFQAAAKACASDLRPQGNGPGAAGGTPPGSGSSSD